ncbi:MAG: choice-of-anchor B family protein [Bacteroidota bacterium]
MRIPLTFWMFSLYLLAGLVAFAQPSSKNVSLVGQRTYPHELNDIWGYVDSSGTEYALVGLTHGTSITSLADPSQPQEVAYIPGAISNWRDLKTFDHYAYVTNETDNGVLIIDLQYLPDSVVYKDTVMAGIQTAHNLWIDEFGRMYLVGTNNFSGGVVIFDLTNDPWDPAFLGFYDDEYVHDIYVRGGLAYLGEIYTGTLSILNVMNPSNPFIIGAETYLDGFTHNTWLNDAGTTCFTTDEYNGASVIAWDVSDPANIQEQDHIQSQLGGGLSAPHNVHVHDDFLLTSYYRDGLHIVDASRPEILVEVGHYDTSPLEGGGFSGAWGAYPFLPSGLVLVSDIEEGLFVLEPEYQRAGFIEGVIRDAATGIFLDGVEVRILDTLDATTSDVVGFYGVGVADSGTYSLEFSRFGYETDTLLATVDQEETLSLSVDLVPLPRVDYLIKVLEAGSMAPIEGASIQAQVMDTDLQFAYETNLDGEVFLPRFVIESYEFIAGRWGYVTQATQTVADSSQAELVFLLEPGYYDDFSLDFGWTVEGAPRNGAWERGEPIGTYATTIGLGIFNPEEDVPNDIGEAAYVTGNMGGAPFGDDVDRGFTRLVSPPIDLSRYAFPRINYYWWFVNWSLNNGGQPGNDFFSVSLTDGIDTFEVRRYLGPFANSWNQSDIRVDRYFPPDREIQVLFYTQDFEPGNQDGVEAAVDLFRVLEGFPLSTEAELDPSQLHVYVPATESSIRLRFSAPVPTLPFQGEIMDLQGRRLHTFDWARPQKDLWLDADFPTGVYLVRLVSDQQLHTVKFFIP